MSDRYVIYNAGINERQDIAGFFSANWKRAQILEKESFEYFFSDGRDDTTFAIAKSKATGNIVGVCGLIKCSDWFGFISCFLAIKEDNHSPAYDMVTFILSNGTMVSSLRISKDGRRFWQKNRNFTVESMNCYYKLFDRPRYEVASVTKKIIINNNAHIDEKYDIAMIDNEEQCRKAVDEMVLKKQTPFKSKDYIVKRYFKFPFSQYRYEMYGGGGGV